VLGLRVWNGTASPAGGNEIAALKSEVENLPAAIERKLRDAGHPLDDKINTALAGLKRDLMDEIHRTRSNPRQPELVGNDAPCPPGVRQPGPTSPSQSCPSGSQVTGTKSAAEAASSLMPREQPPIEATVRKPLARWVQLIAPDASCGSSRGRTRRNS